LTEINERFLGGAKGAAKFLGVSEGFIFKYIHEIPHCKVGGVKSGKLLFKPSKWLWPGVIPAGKLTLLVGDPGVGKSLLTLDIAARVTRGRPWPDCSAACAIGEVILLSAEDDPADTIKPRLLAAGAVCDLIHY